MESGPLTTRSHRSAGRVIILDVIQEGTPGSGWLDVLVGVDGSDESTASVSSALETLEPALRRVTITSVLDIETARITNAVSTDENAVAAMRRVERLAELPNAELLLLAGRADRALGAYADDESYDAILVGHQGKRLKTTFLGSTVNRLAHTADIPVLIGPSIAPALTPRLDSPEVHCGLYSRSEERLSRRGSKPPGHRRPVGPAFRNFSRFVRECQ